MIYYDRFADGYVTEKDAYAPPERYLAYMKGEEGIYVERYSVYVNGDPSHRLDFAYSELERTNYPQMVAIKRKLHFERHNVFPKSATLIAYVVPVSVYNKIIEEWDLADVTKGGESDA